MITRLNRSTVLSKVCANNLSPNIALGQCFTLHDQLDVQQIFLLRAEESCYEK